MKIAIASGKGGTGKTTIATNLAYYIAQSGENVQYIDCDVEEPNGHIFLKPKIEEKDTVTVGVPDVDLKKCNMCGKCAEFCQYNAIACLKNNILVFEELCHSCGGCMMICPCGAMCEKQRAIGVAEFGVAGNIKFGHGKLNVGAIQTPALIKYVKKKANINGVVVIDVPPGTSCPVIEAIKNVNFVVLVTEPTPFGLNDLELAVGMVRTIGIPFGVAINRCDIGDGRVVAYCKEERIDILLEIPHNRKIAENYSNGNMILQIMPELNEKFETLYNLINRQINV
ncbi:MAG: ATP-binding protein [Candidatus Auribacterota bacterium]|jgi:MinD superfamily P-loop ATPase|nr:ATP-binding protein [Candidatus Auribacterota bacterium]